MILNRTKNEREENMLTGNVEKCPYCKGNRFVEGKQSGYATIAPTRKVFTFKSQILYHQICLDCGAVVKSYVKDLEVLVTKK